MRRFGLLALVLAMVGWTAWFVVCNVYEFAPDLDRWAFIYGGLISVSVAIRAWRAKQASAVWLPALMAACIGVYLLLIHRGVSAGPALALLVVSSLLVFVLCRPRR